MATFTATANSNTTIGYAQYGSTTWNRGTTNGACQGAYQGTSASRSRVGVMVFSGAGAALYYLSGNTEFYWSTYQSLPATGFNGIPVALLAVNNPIGVVFTAIFMAMLDIVGQQLTGYTAYNEYITDVIISVIVYLSAFSMLIKMLIGRRREHKHANASNGDADKKKEAKA